MIYQDLNTKIKSCELEQALLQGTTDETFGFTLIKNGNKILLNDTDKINAKILYNPREEFGKTVYDGSFYLQSTDSEYAIVVEKITTAKGEHSQINIPFLEGFVSFSGKNELILEVVRGEKTLYTFGLFYDVVLNDGYSPKSTPDNLPSYEKVKKEIEDVKTQSDTNKNDIATNTQAIADKAKKDLSDVVGYASIPTGGVLVKDAAGVKHSGIVVTGDSIDASTKSLIVKDVQTQPGTVYVGYDNSISSIGNNLQMYNKSTDSWALLVKAPNDADTGTSRATVPVAGVKDNRVVIQPDASQQMNDVKRWVSGHPAYNRQVQRWYAKLVNPVTNFCYNLEVDGKIIGYYPSKNAWDGKVPGYNLGANEQVIPVQPFFDNDTTYSIALNMKADQPINMYGNGTVPWYALDINKTMDKEIPFMEDLTPNNYVSGASFDENNLTLTRSNSLSDITARMPLATQTTSGAMGSADKAKLDTVEINAEVNPSNDEIVSAVSASLGNDDWKSGGAGGSTTFVGLTDTPANYTGQSGKIPAVKSSEDGLEFVDVPIPSAKVERYAWEGRGIPTFPTGKTYNNYYFQIDVLPDSAQAINIPATLGNGTLITVENNDRKNTMYLRPDASETINGNSGVYRLDSDMLIYMVKQGTNWVVAFKGVFPNNLQAMKSTIKVLLDSLAQIHHFTTIDEMNKITPTTEELAIVDNDGNNFVGYYKYSLTENKWKSYPAQGLIMSDISGAIPKLIKTVVFGNGFSVQQAGDQEDAVLITYTPSGGGTGEITFTDTNTNSEFKSTQIKSTDKSIRIMENQDGSADLSKGANDRNEGIHVMLGNDELINSKFPKSKLYFGDFKVKGGSFVYPNMKNKSFILQDIDPQDDPNVSGGTTFFVAIYYEPNLNLENDVTQKGNIKIELVDNNDNPIMDVNGDPMGVQIDYEPNDISKRELYVGECQIKAYTEVHPKIELDFPSEEIISVGANTQICIQSVTKDESGGPALDSFMLYTGYRFGINTKYYGFNSMNLARTLVFPELENDTGADYHMDFGNNLYFDSITNCKISIAENTFIVKDDNVNLPVWSIARYYNGLDAIYMSGKNYKVTAKLQDKDNAFDISVLEYNGSDALPPKPKLLRYDNGSPAFTSGWSKIDTMFISEDIISGVHTATKDFFIPENSKGIAIIMYPNSSQIPTTLKLKDLEGDITPWFNKIVVTDNSRISEKYLLNHKENYISAVKTPSGISSYRYTVNALDTKLPIGVVSGGDGKIVNDNSWHDAGSTDPNKTQGDFKFLADGTVTMKYTARCLNEQATMNQIDFRLVKVSDDSDVTGSNYVTTIEGSRTNPKMVMSKEFTFDVKANETYRFIGKSDKDDGFYIQSALDGVPLIKFDIKFEEITAQDKAINDKLTLMDDEFVITPEAQQAGVYVEVDYKDGKPTMSTKIR